MEGYFTKFNRVVFLIIAHHLSPGCCCGPWKFEKHLHDNVVNFLISRAIINCKKHVKFLQIQQNDNNLWEILLAVWNLDWLHCHRPYESKTRMGSLPNRYHFEFWSDILTFNVKSRASFYLRMKVKGGSTCTGSEFYIRTLNTQTERVRSAYLFGRCFIFGTAIIVVALTQRSWNLVRNPDVSNQVAWNRALWECTWDWR